MKYIKLTGSQPIHTTQVINDDDDPRIAGVDSGHTNWDSIVDDDETYDIIGQCESCKWFILEGDVHYTTGNYVLLCAKIGSLPDLEQSNIISKGVHLVIFATEKRGRDLPICRR